MDSNDFRSIIVEDILELIRKEPCCFCKSVLKFEDLGGFEHGSENILDLI
jgi:hypothetical protein